MLAGDLLERFMRAQRVEERGVGAAGHLEPLLLHQAPVAPPPPLLVARAQLLLHPRRLHPHAVHPGAQRVCLRLEGLVAPELPLCLLVLAPQLPPQSTSQGQPAGQLRVCALQAPPVRQLI